MSEIFFTFADRSLAYDCVKCGQQCCRGYGLDLDGSELVQFARLEPRLAVLLQQHDAHTATMVEASDGCWMLQSDGWCAIETKLGRAAKPATCRLFPFNKIFTIGETRFVDFASLGCPLQDATPQLSGQGWTELAAEVELESGKVALQSRKPAPRGSEPFDWIALEGRVRDAILRHLDQPDYAEFAAAQEEEVLALSHRLPPPAPAPSPRAAKLRDLLALWRSALGISGDAAAARAAARQVALYTCHLRLKLLLDEDAPQYTVQLQRAPKLLLATAFLTELGHLGRKGGQSLRTVSETFTEAAALIGLLAFFDRRGKLKHPLDVERVPEEVRPAVRALSETMLANTGTVGDGVARALSAFDPHLRGLALSALAFGDATLKIEHA